MQFFVYFLCLKTVESPGIQIGSERSEEAIIISPKVNPIEQACVHIQTWFRSLQTQKWLRSLLVIKKKKKKKRTQFLKHCEVSSHSHSLHSMSNVQC